MTVSLPSRSLFIVGPTASGKSAVALAVAERVGGEIVNADAFQLYQGMDVLSAKPSRADRERVPHHLYDVLPISETCDAQRYRSMALPIIQAIAARGSVPIIVGGSGLYLKALTHGLAPLPAANPILRARLAHLSRGEKLFWLLHRDPRAADTVPLGNPRYVERALEICLLTGRPQSALRQNFAQTRPSVQGVLLHWPREMLYQRINERVLAMLAAGLIEEVRQLRDLGPTAGKAIGVAQIRGHLAGALPLTEAVSGIQQATRQYAKRQTTWFKRESWLQTICLDSQATAQWLATEIVHRFPCLKPAAPSFKSRSI